ncbi:MAG: hypothetical protein AAGA56_13100, partial [Myxococcota bacterium]
QEWKEHLYEWPGSWYHSYAGLERHLGGTYSYLADYRFAPDFIYSIPTLINELSRRLQMPITPGNATDYYKAMERMRSLASDGLVLFTESGLFHEAVALTAEHVRLPHEYVVLRQDPEGVSFPEVVARNRHPGCGLISECYMEMIEDRIPFDHRDEDSSDLVSWEDVAGGG